MNKPIEFSHHAREQFLPRGSNEAEIVEAIRGCPWEPAELGRLSCRKEFAYNK